MFSKALSRPGVGVIVALPVVLGLTLALAYKARRDARQASIDAEASLSMVARDKSFSIGEPVAVVVSLKNKSQRDFITFSPRDSYVDFACHASDGATKVLVKEKAKPPFSPRSGRFPHPRVVGESELKSDVYLNQYVQFLKPGVVKLDCGLRMPVYHVDAYGRETFKPDYVLAQQKTFTFIVGPPDQRRLQKKLNSLLNSRGDKPYSRMETAIGGLEFVPSFMRVRLLPRLVKTKTIDSNYAVRVAARYPSPEATNFIKFILLNPQDRSYWFAQDVALPELARRKVVLQEKELNSILTPGYSGTAYATGTKKNVLDYMDQMPNKNYLPLLQNLVLDEDPMIAQEAQGIIEAMRYEGLLGKVGPTAAKR